MDPLLRSVLGTETHEAEVYGKLDAVWGWHPLGRGSEAECTELAAASKAATGSDTRVVRAFERTTLRSFIHKLTEAGVVVRLDETAFYILRTDGDKPVHAYVAPRVTIGDVPGLVEFRFNPDKPVNTSPHCYLVPFRRRNEAGESIVDDSVLCLVMGSP